MLVSLSIRLLGTPRAERDGDPVQMRGRKSWTLLAFLVRSPRPVARARVAQLLFPDASDPQAALRWNLSELRRCLGVRVGGDPIVLELPPDVSVDVDQVAAGSTDEAMALVDLDEEFLEGLDASGSVDLDVWLEAERRHLRGLAADVRREAALALLGRGETSRALSAARRVVETAPLDENAWALLVRCLRAEDRHEEARETVTYAARHIREELGLEPALLLRSATDPLPGGDRGVSGRGAVLAHLETGRNAVAAGAVDAGLESLRAALVAARTLGDRHLIAGCLVALGSELIHSVRGVDQDALTLLHEATPLAEASGDAALVASATREIGYVDFLRARYERATVWFGRARDAAGGDTLQRGWIDVYDGAARTDMDDETTARELLTAALDSARSVSDPRLGAFAQAMLGRDHLLHGDLDPAVGHLEASIDTARSAAWTGFVPFPESMLADATRQRGDLRGARELAEHALTIGRRIADPCWESVAGRSLGLIAVDEGRMHEGLALLADAPEQCRRLPDTWIWVEAWGLDATADVTTARGLEDGALWTARLSELASTHRMRRFAERARLYEGRGVAAGA